MTYALAGHCPPLWYRRSTGAVELLTTETGLMIGIVENPEIQEVTIQLEPGDSVLFYTDGTMECPNERREQFGLDGLKNVMERVGHLSSQQILDRLGSELDQFRGEQPFDDDLTAIALSMEG